ncbi:MAG: HAD-IB family phosphatase [Acidithiobacillus sp.]|uniref:HAD-IB family phosphatase n=1 Tax=Acidithiobacillus sp. TaxID=1872118 RepID=UPI003D092D50
MVFCDFDGTISEEEVFVGLMRHFAPAAAARILPEIYAQRLTLRQGLPMVLESIPSGAWPAMEDFVRGSTLRPGFAAFLSHLRAAGVPLIVVTGGFVEMSRIVLGPLAAKVTAIHGLEADRSGPFLRVHSAWEDDVELVAKPLILTHYHPDEAVCIGDSITDLRMARVCPQVFARDRLAEYLRKEDRPFVPFADFFDVDRAVGQRWWPEDTHG